VAFAPSQPEQFSHVPQYQDKTEMNWPITPEGLYRHLISIASETGDLPLYITENGAAFDDGLSADGTRCHDPKRIDFLRAYIGAARRAVEAGVPLKGYFLWSLIDNFEWAHGYGKRFGIIYCDYVNQRRIPKDSFYFYRDLISGYERV
jgi:beta-glucosidase